MEGFDRPVAFLHGDTHLFRIDKPLYSKKTKRLFKSFTRVEHVGCSDSLWVRITVDRRRKWIIYGSPRPVYWSGRISSVT